MARAEPVPPPLLLAHRGALLERVENTMPAFARALELGADGVELDVRLSSDGVVVVFHDADLVRLAARPEAIASMTWAQLSLVALHGGARIPCLQDVIDAWPDDRWLDVELKAGAPGLADATVDCLRERSNVFLSSFDPRVLERARGCGWGHTMALLLERQSPAFLHAEGGAQCGAQAVILDAQICSEAAVSRYCRLGYEVGIYGARDAEHEARLADLGIRWLITDRPRRR